MPNVFLAGSAERMILFDALRPFDAMKAIALG